MVVYGMDSQEGHLYMVLSLFVLHLALNFLFYFILLMLSLSTSGSWCAQLILEGEAMCHTLSLSALVLQDRVFPGAQS